MRNEIYMELFDELKEQRRWNSLQLLQCIRIMDEYGELVPHKELMCKTYHELKPLKDKVEGKTTLAKKTSRFFFWKK